MLYSQLDLTRQSVHKTRRCFVWNNQYFQLDIYKEPCHPRCKGLLILETYTTNTSHSMETPDFLDNVKEVTGDPLFSMFHLSRKDWIHFNSRCSYSQIVCGTRSKYCMNLVWLIYCNILSITRTNQNGICFHST